jgi:uncharacterized protein YecT (DUF1311 family)
MELRPMKLCGFVYVLITGLLCAAQKVDTFSDCQKRANSQHDLQACADHEFRGVDADMRQNYQQLLTKTLGDAVAEKKIKAAQQSWLSFRDAQLEAMYPHTDKLGEYGSSYPTCALLLKIELTRQRTIMLSRMLSPVEGEVCDAGLHYRPANLSENSPVPRVATPASGVAGGTPLLVTLEGRLTKRSTESGTEKDTIVVEHFDRTWSKQRCPSRSAGNK